MVVNGTADVNLPVQPLAVLAAIQLVLEGLAHRYFTPSRLACSRIITSSLAVMLIPDFSANALKRRLASRLSLRLVACGFSIPQLYNVYAVQSKQQKVVSLLALPALGIAHGNEQTPYISALKRRSFTAFLIISTTSNLLP